MKKILLGLLLATSALTMGTSCTKEYYEVAMGKSYVYTVNKADWSSTGGQYVKTLVIPELDKFYLETGTIQVSMSANNGVSYDIIPSTFEGVAYSVNYELGKVTIYAQDPILDDSFSIEIPNKVIFKVTLTDAEDRT